MDPIVTKRRHEKWVEACRENEIEFRRGANTYKGYVAGKVSFRTAFTNYKYACDRHKNTNYDLLWLATEEERREKAKKLQRNKITFDQAIKAVNRAYRVHIRQLAYSLV